MSNFQSHPISIITSFESTKPTQTVKPNHNRTQFEDILKKLNKNLNKFDALTKYSIESFKLENDETIKEILEDGRKTLISNSLSQAYLDKFETEIRNLSSTDLLKFVKESIGVDSSRQRCQKAIQKINDSSRNTENDEKFDAFLKRLKSTADEMEGAAADVKTYFIEKIFRDNLTPTMRSFLLEQNYEDKSIEEISKLLDKCQKYRKNISVFQIQAQVSDEKTLELTKIIQQLTTQNESLAAQNDSLLDFLKDKVDKNDAEICKLKATQKEKVSFNLNENQPENQRINRPRNNQTGTPSFPPSWELNEAGFPIRCTSCGYRGHRTNACKGTQATCNICRRQGHIAPACPQKSNRFNYSTKN